MMPLHLPGAVADRIEAWNREEEGYEGMTLGDLLSEQDLLACIVALRLVEKRMLVAPGLVECPACARHFKEGNACELPTCFLRGRHG